MNPSDIVLGSKTYSRDFRANDIKTHPDFKGVDWGVVTLRALFLRARRFSERATDVDLAMLAEAGVSSCFMKQPSDANGDQTFRDLMNYRADIIMRDVSDDYICTFGEQTKYVGQPICLLIFEDILKYLDAQRQRDFLASSIKFSTDGQDVGNSFVSNDILELAAPIFDADEWPVKDSDENKWSTLAFTNRDGSVGRGRYDATAVEYIATSKEHRFRFLTQTPAIDAAHLEPDSSLGRVIEESDGAKTVELIVPSQSQYQDYKSLAFYSGLRGYEFDFFPIRIGGGFGARSSGQFPFYAAVAAIAGQGIPVRLEFDRLEQFVSGIKRHPSRIETDLIVGSDGSIEALDSRLLIDGGSIQNLSQAVASLSTHSSGGAYRIHRKSTRNVALKNFGVLSGSMRGFGIPQALFNIEQQVDRIAVALERDAIEYREEIVLRTGDNDISGKPLLHPLKNLQILEKAKAHPQWRLREERKQDYCMKLENKGKRFGTGFALAMEAFGATSDKPAISIKLTKDLNIEIDTFTVQMGQGTVDGLIEYLRQIFAGQVIKANPGSGDTLAKLLTREDEQRLVGIDTNAAARGSFGSLHVLDSIANVWVQFVWLPEIARKLGVKTSELNTADIVFDEFGKILVKGYASLDFAEVAGKIAAGEQASVFGLGAFRNTWAYAEFKIGGPDDPTPLWLSRLAFGPTDAVPSTISHIDKVNVLDPTDRNLDHFESKFKPSRSLYATAGCLVDVAVSEGGDIQVDRVTVILDAGRRLSDSRIKGQIEGGVAQGIGHTLLEQYPSGPLGGQRMMNFDQYAIPRIHNMPTEGIDTIFLDTDEDEQMLAEVPNKVGIVPKIAPPSNVYKGISEISISPIAPAIANAIIDAIFGDRKHEAIDLRFSKWPITSNDIRLRMEALK